MFIDYFIPLSAILIFSLRYFIKYKYYIHINLYILFVSIPIFSYNFAFCYRDIHRLIVFIIIFIYLNHVFIKKRIYFPYYIRYLLIFLLLIIFSWILNINNLFNIIYEFHILLNYIAIFMLSIYIFNLLQNKLNIYFLFNLIGEIGLFLSIFVIIQYFIVYSRIELNFSNSNYLAFYLTFSFLYYLVNIKNLKDKVYLFIIFLAICFTGSRVELIVILFSFIFYVLLKYKTFLKKVLVLFNIIILSVILIFILNKLRPNTQGSNIERIAILYVSKKIIEKNYLYGIGYGQFKFNYKKYLTNEPVFNILKYTKERVTHNDFIKIFIDMGLIGIIFVIYILIKVILLFVREYKNKLNIIVYLYFINVIIFSLFHNNMNSLLFWFFLLLPFHISYLRKKQKEYLIKCQN